MSSHEENVLPPIDPSISDENDWWEFGLSDVKVLRPGKMLYANLLEATDESPVQVIGELQLTPNQEHLALNPDALSKRIIIDDVTHYAYGQTEDRSVELWVAGKAGWYRISPAKSYLPHYNRMIQAVDMYYFLMDKHQNGKKHINPTFRSLCEQYVYHTHGDCETREQSAEVFGTHGPFLLRCMVEDDEDMEWNKTHVFVHLRRKFKDEYKEIMDRLSPQSDKSDEDEDEDESPVTTPRHDPASIAKSQTDAVYRLIQDLRVEGHLARRRLNLDLVCERLSERYSFSKENASKIVAARAQAVLEMLDEEETSAVRWSRYVIHRELSHAASQDEPLPPTLFTHLQAIEDSSDDEALTRTQKSVLRPKNASKSAKVMGKRNRNSTADKQATQDDDADDDDDDDPDAMSDVETPSKTRGHELIRTPLASAKPKTRTKSFLNKDSPAAALFNSILQDTPQPSSSLISSTLPIAKPDFGAIPPLPDLNNNIDPDPQPEPEPESETWACRMQGCPMVITSKGDERQKEIEHHAGEHDWDTQMRVELVEKEQRMHTAFPVSNLMKYLLSQHYQQMREAFPEIYTAKNGNGDTNGNVNGAATPEHHEPIENGNSVATPSPHSPEEPEDHAMNGHAT
ncbi:hypothetical protein N7456_003752 [Penicillium angulare]|uniref:DNA (cytosine-5)-methyltransferase 1 replication foci domain-containing protein n=1 Tax=Penicillium angulare TaxID=116970 RepID=A0A9W9FWY1_9EURO|nr:hypothetical protein N7456_003752 [Penicillium angulare]